MNATEPQWDRETARTMHDNYRAASQRIRDACRQVLSAEDWEHLTMALQLGSRWHRERLEGAIAADPVKVFADEWNGD